MKKINKLLIVCLTSAAIISGVSLIKVSAQDLTLTGPQIESIRSNCALEKNTLNQVHMSDALLRVNRGQVYESILTKLMDRFNSRIAVNGLNNSDFVQITTNYSSTLDKFRLDYKSYEEQLAGTIAIDCQKDPVLFFESISSARNKRTQVHTDVLELNKSIELYKAAVIQFETNYKAATEGVNR